MTRVVSFHCAFEDTEGLFVDPQEFYEEQDAIDESWNRNIKERNRLKGTRAPDAVWFVVKATTNYSVVARSVPTATRKVVRRKLAVKKTAPRKTT